MIPEKADDVTATWFSNALGASVTAIKLEPVGVGVGLLGELYRVHLTGEDVPASVILKLPTHAAANKAIGMAFHFYEREIRFFRDVAPTARVRVPQALHLDMDVDAER
ncbi:MAG: hypothetical protein V7636_2692, partial [Actinomycetota bacterium]